MIMEIESIDKVNITIPNDINQNHEVVHQKGRRFSKHSADSDIPRRFSKQFFGGRKKSTDITIVTKDSSKERRFSRHLLPFLNVRRKSSSVNLDPGQDELSNVSTTTTGRRRSSIFLNFRRKSSAAFTEKDTIPHLLPLQLHGEIPDNICRKAEIELGETASKRNSMIPALRNMIQDKSENSHWKVEDEILLMFLRAKKFDVEKSYKLMENFYNYKGCCYDVHPFTVEQLQVEIELEYATILSQRDPSGSIIGIMRLASYNFDRLSLFQLFNMGLSILGKSLEAEPANQVTGVVVIIDCENLPYGWMKHLKINYAKCLYYTQEGFPMRYKAFHVLNENFIFKMVFKFFEVFISKKIKNRIHFHGKNLSSLHQHIPASILPRELGGPIQPWPRYCYTAEEMMNSNLFS